MTPAAAYLRSSKDRADVSTATQLHELEAIARARGLEIRESFEDAVESGASEFRPGFLNLGHQVRNPKRGWSILLVYDTSRIARRRYIAQAFKHLCKKHGVAIQYAKMPADMDPISELVLEAVFEAFDEVHSLMSRDKAIAAQRENVRRGFRAGGRAPLGYRLEHTPTGALRDGKPVQKSRLVPSDDAPMVTTYLKARATGATKAEALSAAGLGLSKSSLAGMEWNALTYAGHTVWNRHDAKHRRGGGCSKMRPRAQWEIRRDTHPALISDDEAEVLLDRLVNYELSRAVSEGKRAASEALLVGLLVTPDGQYWRAAGKHYRLEGRPAKNVRRAKLEQLVIEQFYRDVTAEGFIEKLVEAVAKTGRTDSTLPVRQRLAKLGKERDRAARLALQDEASAAWVALVDEKEAQIAAAEEELEAMVREAELGDAVRQMTPESVRALIQANDDPALLLSTLVARVTLDRNLVGHVDYWPASEAGRGVCMASPRRLDRFATVPGAVFRVA